MKGRGRERQGWKLVQWCWLELGLNLLWQLSSRVKSTLLLACFRPSLRLHHTAIGHGIGWITRPWAWEWRQPPKTSLLKCKYKWAMIITKSTHNGRESQHISVPNTILGRLAAWWKQGGTILQVWMQLNGPLLTSYLAGWRGSKRSSISKLLGLGYIHSQV